MSIRSDEISKKGHLAMFTSTVHHLAVALVLLAAGLGLPIASAGPVTATYVNDFSSSVADFASAATSDHSWTLTGGQYVDSNSPTPFGAGTVTATVQANNLGGSVAMAPDFNVSGRFTMTDGNGTSSYIALGFLASDTTFSAGTYYLLRAKATYNFTDGGNILELVEYSGSSVVQSFAYGTGSERLVSNYGNTFTLGIIGHYLDTNADNIQDALSLTGTLANLTDEKSWQVSWLDSSPSTGMNFGIKDNNANAAIWQVNWDSFEVTYVPEPASLGLLGLGLLAGLRRRRPAPDAEG